jgi:hypothetical protein
MRRLLLAAAALALTSCGYGPPAAHHRLAHAMPEPGGHRFAVAVMTTERREPAGLLSRLPGGGKPKILSEQMRIYLCDADDGSVAPLGRLARPAQIRSGFGAWIVGWDPPGPRRAIYLEVGGSKGETSDTERLKWLLRVEVEPSLGAAEAVAFLPNEARRPPPQGPLRGGREIQVSLGGDAIDARTDTSPELTTLFRVDRVTGHVAPAPGAVFAGRPPVARPEAAAAGTAVPSAGTAPPPAAANRPAPAIWCDSVDFFLRRVSTATPKRGLQPYEDPISVRRLPACSMQIEGAWSTLNPEHTPWDALGDWLTGLGYERQSQYDADGPDGTAALFRRGDRFLGYSARWWSAEPLLPGTGGGEANEPPPTTYRLEVWSGVRAAR